MNDMDEEYKLKAKQFLERQLVLYKGKIKKLKRKRRIAKSLFVNLIVISMTSSMVCATLSSLIFIPLPIFILPMLNMIAGFTTALSVKFNLEGKKNELKRAINQFDKVQNQIEYIVSCNGTFDAEQYKNVLHELSHFGSPNHH